ncbi:MAG: hypothetical protein LBB75_02635 [Oscillospiraceae bacterium]|jgi:hypothetical protein|nr:hypothetical protein [Oscillospiraceae bacterium]
MTMRKILSVLLCVCAVISVMAVVARSIDLPQAAVSQEISADPTTPTTAAPASTTKSLAQQITDGWEKFKPTFDLIYKFGFQGLSQLLTVGFQWLLSAVGLNFWQGGLFGFLT